MRPVAAILDFPSEFRRESLTSVLISAQTKGELLKRHRTALESPRNGARSVLVQAGLQLRLTGLAADHLEVGLLGPGGSLNSRPTRASRAHYSPKRKISLALPLRLPLERLENKVERHSKDSRSRERHWKFGERHQPQ